MPKRYGYTWEKLFSALTSLAEHRGSIQERILTAMMSAHTVISPHKIDESFPADARAHARAIYEKMTAVEDPSAGSFAASANAMSDEDATQVARWFRQLYFRVHAASGANEWTGEELEPPE